MFGFGKPKQVAETEADGEIERVYHEIKQSLCVSGINLNFRTWAGYEKFFPAMWDAMRPVAETRAFETAADEVRAESVRIAETLGAIGAKSNANLGESQRYQIEKALELYHYINPKLLVVTAKVRQAMKNEAAPTQNALPKNTELIERGIPAKMYPMEMISDEPDDAEIAAIFEDIKKTLELSSINSDYRTFGLWKNYLAAFWQQLKPIVENAEYEQASNELRETARKSARNLPPISLSKKQVEELGEDADEILKTTEKFEKLLPSLVINISLLSLDGKTANELVKSPFPAATRKQGGQRR